MSKAWGPLAVALAAIAVVANFVLPGPGGTTGPIGLNCWDLNGNGVKDVATEDLNGDAVVDARDCQASGTVVVGANGRNYLNTTTSMTFADVPGANVSITFSRTSFLVITFSGEMWMNATGDLILGRALVDSTPAQPGAPGLMAWMGGTDAVTASCTYYLGDVAPGTHTVHILWRTWLGTAYAAMDHWAIVVRAIPQ